MPTKWMLLLIVLMGTFAVAQDQPMVVKPADKDLAVIPGLPECMKGTPMRGDPSRGGAVIYAKATAGCDVPTHWHTANGDLLWISGTARFKMKGAPDQLVKPGMFVRVPSKHPHAEHCTTACSFYAVIDQAFDVHYLDASGNEIPMEQALDSSKPKAAKK